MSTALSSYAKQYLKNLNLYIYLLIFFYVHLETPAAPLFRSYQNLIPLIVKHDEVLQQMCCYTMVTPPVWRDE